MLLAGVLAVAGTVTAAAAASSPGQNVAVTPQVPGSYQEPTLAADPTHVGHATVG